MEPPYRIQTLAPKWCGLIHHNLQDSNLPEKINVKIGSVDIAICNPPYLNIKRSEDFDTLLRTVNLTNSVGLKSYTTDLLFFAQNLSLLKNGGVLGIILPDGLICGHEFLKFRQDLLDNHSVESIIELESKIFKKTEAKTFILIVKKGASGNDNILLSAADENGNIFDKIVIMRSELYERMDYSYHSKKFNFSKKGLPIGLLATSIQRGNYTNLELQATQLPYFHTTNFKEFDGKISLPDHDYNLLVKKPTLAKTGDILLGRVGKSCHNQILFLESGQIAITDCVYRIEVPKSFRKKVFNYLRSKKGKENLQMLKHGVCAQVISKTDLERISIDVIRTLIN